MANIKTADDIARLRASGAILAETLTALADAAAVGVRLSELDTLAADRLAEAGAESAFRGYRPEGAVEPYPAHICTSINDQVVHGLPTDYALRDGDVLKIDFGVNYEEYITDAAVTVSIGEVAAEVSRLISATHSALERAVALLAPGIQLGDIGWTVQHVVEEAGFHILRNLTGHGVGFSLHEPPTVYNYGERGTGPELEAGTVLAIEPMASVSADYVTQRDDESYTTPDGSIAAHFEQTVAVTEDGHEILTPWEL